MKQIDVTLHFLPEYDYNDDPSVDGKFYWLTIPYINAVRAGFDMGLKDAKDFVAAILNGALLTADGVSQRVRITTDQYATLMVYLAGDSYTGKGYISTSNPELVTPSGVWVLTEGKL